LIAELATARGWPSASHYGAAAEMGALMSYGPDNAMQGARLAGYVDRILKGAKPGDLPVQQPEGFNLNLNLKTARRLGVAFPPALQLFAAGVIDCSSPAASSLLERWRWLRHRSPRGRRRRGSDIGSLSGCQTYRSQRCPRMGRRGSLLRSRS